MSLPHVYIAGPMTGLPQFNIPAFDRAAGYLRGAGFTVSSPAELDDPNTRAAALASPDGAPGTGSANGETWGDFLSRDVKLIADGGIEVICVLPGWQRSPGARLETFVAFLAGLRIVRLATPVEEDGSIALWNVPFIELVKAWSAKDDISFHSVAPIHPEVVDA